MANTITATFGLDISPLQRSARQASLVMRGVASRAAGIGKAAVLAGGALLGIGSIAGLVAANKAVLDLGGQMSDLSSKTGIAVDQMLILQQAAKDNGIDDISGAIAKMQASLIDAVRNGTGPAAEAFAELGINARDFIDKTPIEQIKAIGAALQTIKNPALSTAVLRGIFGKSGADLKVLFNDPAAIDNAAASLGRQVDILRDNAARFDTVSDRLGRAGVKMQGFFVGLTASVLPFLEKITAEFDRLDLATAGERFGAAIRSAAEVFVGAFRDPQSLVDALGNGLAYAVLQTANYFQSNMIASAGKAGAALLRAFGTAQVYLQAGLEFAVRSALGIFNSGWRTSISALGTRLLGIFNTAVNFLSNAISQAWKGLQSAPDSVAKTGKAIMTIAFGGYTPGAGGNFSDIVARLQKNNPTLIVADFLEKQSGKLRNTDLFGAEAFKRAYTESLKKLSQAGQQVVNTWDDTMRRQSPQRKDDPFANFVTANRTSALSTGGLRTGTLAGTLLAPSASRTSPFDFSRVADLSRAGVRGAPLLSFRERRALEDVAVAQGATRAASSESAFGVIRKGDAARRKNFLREQEIERQRRENSVARSNELLNGILKATETTAEALN